MDTVVCVKAIPAETPRVRADDGEPGFEAPRSTRLILNESDAYAVDEAVRLRRSHGGRVTALTVGPLASQDALYAAMAKGADDALRIDADPRDPIPVARLLAAAVRRGNPSLVLTGIESRTGLASAVGPALAAELDLPFASSVSAIEIAEAEGRVIVVREIGGGFRQTLQMPIPAVLCVQSGICPLSYPPTVRVLQARRTRPRSVTPSALGVEIGTPATRLVAIETPRRTREVEILEGSPAEIAGTLLDRVAEALGR